LADALFREAQLAVQELEKLEKGVFSDCFYFFNFCFYHFIRCTSEATASGRRTSSRSAGVRVGEKSQKTASGDGGIAEEIAIKIEISKFSVSRRSAKPLHVSVLSFV
jgi:hypothetical protein